MDSPLIPGSPVCKGLWKQVRKSPHLQVLKRHKRLCAERRNRQQQDEHHVHNKQFPQCYQHSYWEELRWALPRMPRAKHWKKRKCLKEERSHLLRKKMYFFIYLSISKSKHTMEAISVQQSADERQENTFMDFQLFLPTVPCLPAESLWSQSALPQQLSQLLLHSQFHKLGFLLRKI